jgi:ATP-dependent Clp protease ATP-binding subunit ClpB
VDIQLRYLDELLADRKINLDLSADAKLWIANKGYDPAYGARPLKRVIQNEIQNKLAEMILKGDIVDGASIHIDAKDKALAFDVKKPKGASAQDNVKSVA